MSFPVYLDFGPVHLPAHQLLELLAYAASFLLYLRLRRRWPSGPILDWEQTGWIMIGAIFGALIGARGLAWLESLPFYWQHRMDWRVLLGGKTIVGALMGGWFGVEFSKQRLRIAHPSGDIYVFPLILGICIGRFGCFLSGLEDHTYGIATRLPWGVDFGDGLRRHPTQLYEVLYLGLLAAFLLWRIRTWRQRGCMFSQFSFAYLGFRFVIEFLKPRFTLPHLGLSPIQIAALGGIAFALWHWNDQCCGQAVTAPFEPADESLPEFAELTNSLCGICLRKLEAKLLIEHGGVFLKKFCPEHGHQKVLIATDTDYWRKARRLYKAPTSPKRRNTELAKGCPWDCGLCPDHEQHSCLAIVEITQACDLGCPVCFAASGAGGAHRSLAEIETMLDAIVANEGEANVVQISGGEPTLHPELFRILDAARARPIRHLMLNSNGLRIARDPAFVARLATYLPGFELYLQFDSLRPETLKRLRGTDLSATRRRALEALNQHGISTTLVVTLVKGLNDGEIGEILDFALQQPCVRGVTFQPFQAAGRLEGVSPTTERLTLTEVRDAILRQHDLFTGKDLVPVPCHTDALAMGYALRRGGRMVPLSRLVDPGLLMGLGGNTICYEQDPRLRERLMGLFSASASPSSAAKDLQGLCCLPGDPLKGAGLRYTDVFRVIIMQFMDAWNMDLRSLKRSCVHIAHPDGRLIPFEVYNLLHRNQDSPLSPAIPSPSPEVP